MDISEDVNSPLIGTSEEIVIDDVLDTYDEIVVEDCTVEIQSTSLDSYVPLDVEETIEVETPIEIEEAEIKTELIKEEEILIPSTDCEIEIDQDINEFECIYIKEECVDNIVVPETSESDSDENKVYPCQLCQRLFPLKTLNAHILQHAGEKYFCVICNKTFKKKHNLDFHMTLHYANNACPVCYKTFANHSSLTAHMSVHNSSAEKVMCNICHKSFQKSYLKIHLTSHLPTSDYTCTFCSKNLSSKQSLYMHINTVHANEGCYECSYCEKRFFWKSYLDRHVTVHTKEKSHHCTFCTKAFTRKLALRKHMSTHVIKGNFCLL